MNCAPVMRGMDLSTLTGRPLYASWLGLEAWFLDSGLGRNFRGRLGHPQRETRCSKPIGVSPRERTRAMSNDLRSWLASILRFD
jgi:hypothetical protein